MTDEEIVKRAKDAEKRTGFGELVHSPISKGVNSAYGIGYIEGMVEYRNSLQEEPVDKCKGCNNVKGCITCVDGDQWAHYEEPVSEELLDTTQTITYNGEVYTRCYKDKLDSFACKYPMSVPKTSKRYAKYSDVDLTIAVKEGAKWQKEQDQSTIELAEDHAMLAGMEKMKEEMMAKAIDGIARPDDNEIWCNLTSSNLKDGDKVKVIVIKDE